MAEYAAYGASRIRSRSSWAYFTTCHTCEERSIPWLTETTTNVPVRTASYNCTEQFIEPLSHLRRIEIEAAK